MYLVITLTKAMIVGWFGLVLRRDGANNGGSF